MGDFISTLFRDHFDPAFSVRLTWTLIHAVWQCCAIAGASSFVAWTLRHSTADKRYLSYFYGLLLMVASLTGTFLWFDSRTASSIFTTTLSPTNTEVSNDVGEPAFSAGVASDDAQLAAAAEREHGAASGLTGMSMLNQSAPYVSVAYGLGVLGMLARLGFSLRGSRRLRRSSTPVREHAIVRMVARQSRRLSLHRIPAIARCPLIEVPVVVGVLKPLILLPAALASGLTPAQLEPLLAHELAHLRRLDLIANLLQRVAEAILFFHPAAWYLSRRISWERESACDDLVVSAGWQSERYAEALLRMAEVCITLRKRCQPTDIVNLAAAGQSPGQLRCRILRLLGHDSRSSLRLTKTTAMAFLLLLALSGALLWNVSMANEMRQETTQAEEPVKEHSLDIIIAEHVFLWDGQIVTWDEVIAGLRDMRQQQNAPIHANFHSTNGAIKASRSERYEALVMKVYPELFQPAGVSLGALTPRASERYDAIRTPEDLIAKPDEIRRGVVRDQDGTPVADATVVLMPDDASMSVMLKTDLQLRDPLCEVWVKTDAEGGFEIAAPDKGYRIAVLSTSGFAMVTPMPSNQTAEVRLYPPARLKMTGGEGGTQPVALSIHPKGLPNSSPGFAMYEVTLEPGVTRDLSLPPGAVQLSRSFDVGERVTRNYQVQSLDLKPDESRELMLPYVATPPKGN